MGELDHLLETIGQIHAAGTEPSRWPVALASVVDLVGGVASTFEMLERRNFSYVFFSAAGVPPPEEIAYLNEYAKFSPPVPAALRQKPGELAWDYQILDEAGMDHDPFYANFLAPMDMRYSTAALLKVKPTEFAALAVQRSARHGHVDERELKLMAEIEPHASQALDVMLRLRRAERQEQTLDAALDWLAEAALQVDRTGRVTKTNVAAEALIARHDGVAIVGGAIEFASTAANAALQNALSSLVSAGRGPVAAMDFTAARAGGTAPYSIAVRPAGAVDVLALVFVRDPFTEAPDAETLLRAAFGLTAAEARLAVALLAGLSPEAYAEAREVSRNTVYTHLRRLKDKCGQSRMVELVRALSQVGNPHIRPM